MHDKEIQTGDDAIIQKWDDSLDKYFPLRIKIATLSGLKYPYSYFLAY
jgi:hypothetical protein